jgi:hypothetical protein
MKSKSKKPNATPRERRVAAAGKNLKRIEKEIAPYIKPKRYEVFSTAGTWRETGSSSCVF